MTKKITQPNWPSKVPGMASGKDRDNNPPKKTVPLDKPKPKKRA